MLKKLSNAVPAYGIKVQMMQPIVEEEVTVQVVLSTFEEMPKEMIGKGNPTIRREVNAIRSAESFEEAEEAALKRCLEMIGVL